MRTLLITLCFAFCVDAASANIIGGDFFGGGNSNAPSVDLNFAANTATGCSTTTSCLSVTRTTTETCEPINGVVSYATSGNPCVTSEGLQVYQAGTNLVLRSASTTGYFLTNATYAAGAAGTAPDNTNTAFIATDNSTNSGHGIETAATAALTSGLPYVMSVFIKPGTCAGATFECEIGTLSTGNSFGGGFIGFNASNCSIIFGSSSNIKVFPPKAFSNGWCRFAFMENATSSVTSAVFVHMAQGFPSNASSSPGYVGSGSTMQMWGFSMVQGTTLLPYCATNGSATTCNADVIEDTGALQTAFEGSALQTVFKTAEFSDAQQPQAQTLLGVGSGLTGLGIAAGYAAQTNWPSAATLQSGGTIIHFHNNNYFGLSGNASGRSMALNGQTANTDSNGLSVSSQEYIGSLSTGAAYCNCVIAEIKVWNTRNDSAMEVATANSAALPLVASYTGSVANHTRIPSNLLAAATATQAMTRSHHRATSNITSLSPIFANYYSGETAPGATSTVTASVEYPSGTCTQLLFSGIATGVIPNGGILASGSLTLSIPSGADFWIRNYRVDLSGIVYVINTEDTISGEAMHYGTTGITDQTTSCDAVTNTASNDFAPPTAIVGPTQLHSYCPVGDSRTASFDDGFTEQNGILGDIDRWVNPYYSVLNLGVAAQTASGVASTHTQLIKFLPYCTGMFVNLGVNDVYTNSETAATVEADLQSIYALQSNLNGGTGPVWQTTIMAETTSTDNWLTVANQTAKTGSTTINTINAWIRANTAAITGYFENSTPVSTAQDSDIWLANGVGVQGYTVDGIHGSQQGYLTIQNAHPFPMLQ